VNWNTAAEEILGNILSQTPRPVREAAENGLRSSSEALAQEEGINRVGVETVIKAWIRDTPEALRSDLPRQLERLGLDPDDYRNLLD